MERGPDQIQLGVINVSEDARGRMGESLHCRDPFPLTGPLSFWINPTAYRRYCKGARLGGLDWHRTGTLQKNCIIGSMPR